jgi:hypothetical protein
VDENLLQQLQSGENIHIVLNPMDLHNQDSFSKLSDQYLQTTDGTNKSSNLPPNSNVKEDSVSTSSGRRAGRSKIKNDSENQSLPSVDLSRILNVPAEENSLAVVSSSEQLDMTEIRDWNQVKGLFTFK